MEHHADTRLTFKLRKNATFHDGAPVTAKDVKWSYDRAVTVGGFPTFQMKAGSLEKPEQFVVVDDHTFRIDLIRKDNLTVPDIAVVVPAIYNSELLKKKANEKDPWALEYTKSNTAGGGAYKVTRWQPGTEVVFERNDAWKSGALPKVRRVIWRMVPSAGNRRALIERGDADISFDLPNKDFVELKQAGKIDVVSTPITNGIQYIGMNVKKAPFDNVKVRQAVAYAIPYQKIMDAVLFGLANPLLGQIRQRGDGSSHGRNRTAIRPTSPRRRHCSRKRAIPNGFETTLSFDLGAAVVNEPLCVLVQESLAQVGIKVSINKVPGANWRAEMTKKEMPLIANFFSGWLDYPEYFFFWCYHGQNALFNTMSYQSKDMDALIDAAREAAAEGDKAGYDKSVKGFVDTAIRGRAAHSGLPAIPQRRDAEERVGLSLLVPSSARLSDAGEGLGSGTRHACKLRRGPHCGADRLAARMAGPQTRISPAFSARPWRPNVATRSIPVT